MGLEDERIGSVDLSDRQGECRRVTFGLRSSTHVGDLPWRAIASAMTCGRYA